MNDPFSTPPPRPTKPASIGDRLRISKKTFIALLNSLPFHELDLQWQFISDDDDNSATLRFIRELGRALSNVQITPSAMRKSPKKLLSDTLDGHGPHRFLPAEEETPIKPRWKHIETPLPTTTQAVPSSEPCILPEQELQNKDTENDQRDAKRKRHEAFFELYRKIEAGKQGISCSQIGLTLTGIENRVQGSHTDHIIPRAVLDQITWDHPRPDFPPRSNDDPLVKAMFAKISREAVQRDPYSISRLAKEPTSNLPFVYIRGHVENFNSEFANEEVDHKNKLSVEGLALWDTGNEHTIVCNDYFDVQIPDRTITVMSFE
jgi:hypothetical protein